MIQSKGPVEDLKWAEKLQASVVTPGLRPRIHGYDVRGELLGKTSFSEILFLSFTGELPDRPVLEAFNHTMVFLSPISVAEAPVHAAVLSGLCGSETSGITGVASITLAERARWTVDQHLQLFSALEHNSSELPSVFLSENEEEREETAFLFSALKKTNCSIPSAFSSLKPISAALAALYSCCGVRNTGVLEVIMVIAGLPCCTTEGMAVKPGNFKTYPIELPPFEYRDN